MELGEREGEKEGLMIEEPSFSFFLFLSLGGVGWKGGRLQILGAVEALLRRMNFRLVFNHTQTHAHVDVSLLLFAQGRTLRLP